jgi:exodeoxyribonuclease VII large subunit
MNKEFQTENVGQTRDILSVSELNRAVSRLLEQSFDVSWVRGEISNFTPAASGHWYFTLKDDAASVRAVMFRGRASAVGFSPKSGDSVEIRGRVTLYEARGEYQVQVEQMRRAGLGSLFEAFVALKAKLETEGLFDPEQKRELPLYPRAVGIVTSLAAAALRDVLTTLARRAPHLSVVIYPAAVQGAEAALQLRQALAQANERQEVDVVLLVRGGGSIEDLWSFNDEGLARDIASSLLPVVSGVGHETDFTIADFVSDVRAPTPTAAAELVCMTRGALLAEVEGLADQLIREVQRKLERLAQRLDRAAAAVVSPGDRLMHQAERLSGLKFRLQSVWQQTAQRRKALAARAHDRLQGQLPDLSLPRARLARAARAMVAAQQRAGADNTARLGAVQAQLRALSPSHTLARGYAIVRNGRGEIVRQAASLKLGAQLDVTLSEGGITVDVQDIRPSDGG